MENLQQQIEQRGATYLAYIADILNQPVDNRTKIAIIYNQYIQYAVDVEEFVRKATTQSSQPNAVSR